jgi:hypothetical protein
MSKHKIYDNSKDALVAIMNDYGADVLLGRLNSLFADYAPGVSQNVKGLVYKVHETGAAQILKDNISASQADKEIAVKKAIVKLTDAFIVEDVAKTIIYDFAAALGWKISAPPPPQPQAQPITHSDTIGNDILQLVSPKSQAQPATLASAPVNYPQYNYPSDGKGGYIGMSGRSLKMIEAQKNELLVLNNNSLMQGVRTAQELEALNKEAWAAYDKLSFADQWNMIYGKLTAYQFDEDKFRGTEFDNLMRIRRFENYEDAGHGLNYAAHIRKMVDPDMKKYEILKAQWEQKQKIEQDQQRKEHAQRKAEHERKRKVERWRRLGLCQNCGGKYGGLIVKKCKICLTEKP